MRTVIVASSTANKAKKIQNFSGTTWGELKAVSEVAELLSGNLEAIVNPGNVTLSREDSQLPEGDFKVFLVPVNNKAGMNDADAAKLGLEVAAMIQKAAKKASEAEASDLKEDLKSAIENFFDVDDLDQDVEDSASDNNDEDDSDLDDVMDELNNYTR